MIQSPLTASKFLRAFIAWWIVWSVLQAGLLVWLGLQWQVAVTDSLTFNLLSAAGCVLLSCVMQFYLPQKERYWYILIISIVLSTLVLFISKAVLVSIYSNDEAYLTMLNNSFMVRWGFTFLLIICMSMICVLWYSFQEQREFEKRKATSEALNKEAELIALRRQLQPHFLFNSLNSISALTGTRPQEAREMIQQLSDFLRGTIKKDDSQIVSLDEELQHIQLYLGIEKVRFGHRLITQIKMDDESAAMKLPALILQPIVENAIKFGLYDTTENVTISIATEVIHQDLIVTVSNPFDSGTAHPQKGTGFGLTSVQRRLYLLFARNDLMTTSAENNHFTTILKIPQAV